MITRMCFLGGFDDKKQERKAQVYVSILLASMTEPKAKPHFDRKNVPGFRKVLR